MTGLASTPGEESLLAFSHAGSVGMEAPLTLPRSRESAKVSPTLTSRFNWMHEPVHLDIPVFHVGAGLAQLPLGGLWDTASGEWVRATIQGRVPYPLHRPLSM